MLIGVTSGERTGEDAAGGSMQKNNIISFSVDSALVPVGDVVQLRCRVSSLGGGAFLQLSKWIPGTSDYEVLTTNLIKEEIISGIDRYSIAAEEYGEGGYDFIFTITGSPAVTLILLTFTNSLFAYLCRR